MINYKFCTFPVFCLMISLACSWVAVDARNLITSTEEISLHHSDTHLVRYSNGHLSVQVKNVSIQELLEDIAAQSGLSVVGEVDPNQRLTLEFHELNLSQALGRILGHRSFNFILLSEMHSIKQTPATDAVHEILWLFPHSNEQDVELGEPENAVSELGNSEDSEAIDQLTLMLADVDVGVRLQAAFELAIVGGNQAITALTSVALGDEVALVRKEAVYALGEIGGEHVTHVVEYTLMDPDDEVREAAIDAYADIGGDKSVMILATALNDNNASLRAKVVDALGEIGGVTAISFLQHALVDEEDSIREAAAEYLDELSSQTP